MNLTIDKGYMNRFRVAITIRSFNINTTAFFALKQISVVTFLNKSGNRLNSHELISAIGNADGVIAGTEVFSKQVIESSKNLKVLSRVGAGLDSIDLHYAKKFGIAIFNTPDAPVPAVAEHTLALILTLAKQIPRSVKNDSERENKPGFLIQGRTVGIIGLGRIGKRVAELLYCFGCRISYYDPFISPDVPGSWHRVDTVEELLTSTDIISLHTPSQPDDEPLLNSSRLKLCKRGSIIINTARGSLLDNKALYECLCNGLVSAAGLDVITEDQFTEQIKNHPHVIITPHVASNTVESREEMETEAIQNLISYIKERTSS